MTLASIETFRRWSEPNKQRLQKRILSLIETRPRIVCNDIFDALGLSHQTGSSRLSSLTDIGLVEVVGTVTRKTEKRDQPYSMHSLSDLGRWVMRQPPGISDDALKRMQDVLRDHEQERAIERAAIKAAYLDRLQSAVEKSVEDMRNAQDDLFDGLL